MTKMWIPCPIRRLLQTSLIIENGSFWETDFIKLIYCIFRTKNAYNNFLWNTCTYHFFLFLRIHMKTESILHASSVWSRDGQERAITLWPFKGQWFNNTHNSVRVLKDLIFKKKPPSCVFPRETLLTISLRQLHKDVYLRPLPHRQMELLVLGEIWWINTL